MKRFLFIGHDATRTGAPIVLLHLLRWLRSNNPDWKIDLLLLRGGELEKKYEKVADVFVLPQNSDPTLFRRGANFLKRKLGISQKPKLPNLAPFSRKYDAVVGNTIITLELLECFKQKKLTTFCWVHELDYVVRSIYSDERFFELAQNVDQFIVPCKAVDSMLQKFGLAQPRHLVYEFSEARGRDQGGPIGNEREKLGIPKAAFGVCGSGTIEWRKGVDLFLQIAKQTAAKCPDIYFVWIRGGSDSENLEYLRIRHDFDRLGTNGRVILTGVLEEPHKVFSEMHLFALTSREDPFPLVCLEAASLGKPIICFANAGGMPEFVDADAGAIVPYGDIDAFCNKILDYYGDRVKLEKAGSAAREKVRSSFSEEISCSKIREIISNI